MSYQKVKTLPDLSLNSIVHQEAKQSGTDDHLWRWTRNVIDEFKDLSNEEIKNRLQETAFPYAVCFESWCHDFNCASLIRNSNAFGARCVYYLGERRFNKKGSMGVMNYTPVHWLPTIDDFITLKKTYKIVAVDNLPGAKALTEFTPGPNMLFVFGSEGVGITPDLLKLCDDMIYIPQFGSVRSINAACASAIIMNDYVSRIKL